MSFVSVIMIVLNGEQFIDEAIGSVIAQQGVDWELLIIDDGSSDRTAEIASCYVEKHPDKIRLLFHPERINAGMSASRNLGIANARGDYIAFLDADDMFLPGKLAEQSAHLDAEPSTGMIYGKTLIWHSWKTGDAASDRYYDLGVVPGRTYPPRALFRTLIENRHQTPTTCNAMMRRDVLIELGGFDASFRGMFEDQVLFAKLMLRYPVHVSSRTWAWYRQHESASVQARKARYAVASAHLRFLGALFDFARRSNDAGPDEYRIIARKWFEISSRLAARRTRDALKGLKTFAYRPLSGGKGG